MLLRLGGPCEAGVWCPTVAHILRGVRSSGWARRTGEQCGNAAVGFKPYKIIKISVTFPFQSLYYISEAETPTQPSVGLMLLSHILEYSIYSSCSRSRIVLAFLYTKPKIFSSSVFLFSLSLNLSFALVFQFLFYHRCLRRRWLPFVALFRKIFPNKEILLLSFKYSASVPGHITLPQTCTALHLTHWSSLFHLLPLKSIWGRECLYVQCKPRIPLVPRFAFVKRENKNINNTALIYFPHVDSSSSIG